MSDPGKAVFLSYASQDSEAAKRICEALRAAGVEVWFDQSELRGGDAWDQKLRKQIKECALFMPVISANTQARAEGYFRLEWKLAVDRSHLMADDAPFLFPIVIDDTPDATARVPDKFRDVQWTRLPGGGTSPAFCAQVRKLLGGEAVGAALRRDSSDPSRRKAAPTKKTFRPWLVAAIIGMVTVAALAIWQPWKKSEPNLKPQPDLRSLGEGGTPDSKPETPAPKLSEARQLVAKAWEALQSAPEPSRSDLQIAEDYCRQAAALDATDAEIWAVWSQVDTWYVALQLDRSPVRREGARTRAVRALSLAPKSYEARLAQACYLVRGEGFHTVSAFSAEAEPRLRELLQERPDEPRALLALGHFLRNTRRTEESVQVFDRLAFNPDRTWVATAYNAKGWGMQQVGRWNEATVAAERSIAARPFFGNITLRIYLALSWQGDLDLAKTTLGRMPASDLMEDFGANTAVLVWHWCREPEQMLRVLRAVPREWLGSNAFNGPKDYWVGVAHQMAGNAAAAQTAWRAALRLVEQRVADDMVSGERPGELQYLRGHLLALLGERPAAEQAFALAKQLGSTRSPALLLGDTEKAINGLEKTRWATLRFDPSYDPLRPHPRFQALLAEAEKDPGRSPHAKAPAVDSKPQNQNPGPSDRPSVEPKSVAVLAFANLSDDKGNEYFSDGISEELLNVLAKIPGLKVSARTSAFHFKGKDTPIPEIARQLGVAYVVEGSVRKAGNQVRITAQLIKAADGFHVWSDTFTRDLKDIFAVQDEIAGLIAKNLELKMGIGEAGARQAVSPEAYQAFLIGRAAAAKASMADLREAVVHFERAGQLEPKYTAAWVQLASTHTRLGRWGGAPTLASWAAARAAIDQALALEPDSPEVLLALGWILRTAEWDWRGAERAFRRALALQSTNPEILAGTAVLLFNIGQTDEAFRLARQAVQLDPLNPSTQVDLSIMFFESRNWVESERAARRALQLAPGGTSYHSVLAWPLINQGRYAEAEAELALDTDVVQQSGTSGLLALARGDQAKVREMLARLEELARTQPDRADLQTCTAWLHAGLGDKDRAFAALEKARASRDPSMAWLRVNTELTALFSDPRWPEFLRKIGLADEQLK